MQKYIDELIRLIEQSKVKLDDIVTHRLPLEKAPHAYDIFSEKKDGYVKVVLKPAISENNNFGFCCFTTHERLFAVLYHRADLRTLHGGVIRNLSIQ